MKMAPVRVFAAVCACCVCGLSFAGLGGGAGDAPPAITSQADASGFYRLGEMSSAHGWSSYYEIIADKLDDRWAAFAAQAEKMGASKSIVDSVQEYRKKMADIPLGKPWAQWTPADQKKFTSTGSNADAFFAWLKKPDYQALFFFNLGRTCLDGHFALNRSVLEQNYSIESCKSTISSICNDSESYLTDTGYEAVRKRVAPELLQAIKDIRALKNKLDDPLGDGFTRDDVVKLCQLCKSISVMSKENKLLAEK